MPEKNNSTPRILAEFVTNMEKSFLGATKHLYNWLCPLVGRSVGWLVTHLFNDPHVAPYWPTWPCLLDFRCDKAPL